MASPSEEIRSRNALQERHGKPAVDQASHDAAYEIYSGEDDPLYGWKRSTAHGKDVPYASGGADYKGSLESRERESSTFERAERRYSKEE